MKGYEALRDRAFRYDGFSDESAGYTAMYLSETLPIVERLHGYEWPGRFPERRAAGIVQDRPEAAADMPCPLDHLTPKLQYSI